MPQIGPRASRLSSRLGKVAAGSLALVLLAVGPAGAHASLVEAVPADGSRVASGPTSVVLRFSEHVGVTGDSVRVMGTNGTRVDDGRPQSSDGEVTIGIEGPLVPDTYIVAWRVVSADDHPIHGATTFVVGDGERASDQTIAGLLGDDGDGAWPVLGAIARGLAYLGGLIVVGAVSWSAFVECGPRRRPARNLAVAGALTGATGALASVPIQAAMSTGLGLDAVTDTSILFDVASGPLGFGVAMAAVGFATVAAVTRRQTLLSLSAAAPDAPGSVLAQPAALVGAALIAIGFARSGHTESTDPRALMYGADIVHVLAAGAWLGGLALLALELRATRQGRLSPTVTAEHVARFSALAALVSVAASAAGVALAWGTVRHLDALTSTTYGRTLLVKTALVALVGVAAAFNHWWLVPAVRDGAERARSLLTRTVRLEVAGLVGVVAITAVLVNIEPARVAAGPGLFERTVPFGDGSAVVQVDPAEVGDNAVHIYLLEPTGAQLDLVDPPTFSFSLAAADIGPIERTPYRAGPGHYTVDGPELSMPGTWTIAIRGRVSEFEEVTATVDVTIR